MNPSLENEPAPNEDETRLASYLDGELDAESARALEAELVSNPALRASLDRAVALRNVLAEGKAAFAAPDPGELAFERVRRSIHDALGPSSGAQSPARGRTQVAKVRSATSKKRVFFGVVVAAAAAAAVAMVSFGDVTGPNAGVASNPRTMPAAPSMSGTEIVRVEFGKMSGTYWEENDGAERVAIVWIDDSFPEEVGRP